MSIQEDFKEKERNNWNINHDDRLTANSAMKVVQLAIDDYWNAVKHPEKYPALCERFAEEKGGRAKPVGKWKEIFTFEQGEGWRDFCFKHFIGEATK